MRWPLLHKVAAICAQRAPPATHRALTDFADGHQSRRCLQECWLLCLALLAVAVLSSDGTAWPAHNAHVCRQRRRRLACAAHPSPPRPPWPATHLHNFFNADTIVRVARSQARGMPKRSQKEEYRVAEPRALRGARKFAAACESAAEPAAKKGKGKAKAKEPEPLPPAYEVRRQRLSHARPPRTRLTPDAQRLFCHHPTLRCAARAELGRRRRGALLHGGGLWRRRHLRRRRP
jgi:hypothetical protein